MANVSSSNGLEKRPKLRFPGFDEPYRTTPLGEIASLVNRTDPKSNAPIMMLSAGNGFIMQSEKYSRDNAGQSLKKYILLKQGELAYNHGASKAKQFGCCYELTEPEARIPYVYHCFKINDHEYTPFIAMALNNAKMDKQLKRLVSSSVRMDGLLNISFEDYMSVTLHLPSSTEQKHIADFLKKIDERIAAQEKLLASLKKYKRGLLNKVFSNINGNIYPTVYLSKVADFLQGLTYSPSDVSVSGYLVLRSSNIQNGVLSFDDCVYVDKKVDESLQVKCDDVIMCVRNGSKKLVGKTALIPNNMAMTTWGAFMMIIRSKLNDTYIFHYLNSQMFFSQVFKDTGTATINQITKGILNECKLPLPPETARKQISKMLSLFDVKIQNAEMCLTTLVELKKALLQQLFI